MENKIEIKKDFGEDENHSAKVKLTVQRTLVYILMIFLTIMCLFFFYLLFVSATKSHSELQGTFSLLP